MSYIKNVVIRNLTIRGVDGDIAVLGDNITSIISIDCCESIFEPTITFEILFVSVDIIRSLFLQPKPLKIMVFL